MVQKRKAPKSARAKKAKKSNVRDREGIGGRPQFAPTAVQRGQVYALAMHGLSQQKIATFLTITPKTLAKHFERELREAGPHLLAKATSTVFNTISSANERIALSASMFMLSTKFKDLGWSKSIERSRKRDVWVGADPSKLNDDEFASFIRLCKKMGVKFEDADLPVGREMPLTPETDEAE